MWYARMHVGFLVYYLTAGVGALCTDGVPITWRYWLSYVLCLDYIGGWYQALWSVAGPLMSSTIGSCGCIL